MTTKRAKTTNHSTRKKKPTTKFTDMFEIYDIFTGRSKPVSDDWLENLGKKALKWAMEIEEPLTARFFFRQQGIDYMSVGNWRKRSTKFDTYCRMMLETLADKREVGAVTKKYDAAHVRYTLPQFGQEWKDLAQFHASLKQEAKGTGDQHITVVMEDFGAKGSTKTSQDKQ